MIESVGRGRVATFEGDDRSEPVGHAELPERVLEMLADRAGGDVKPVGDLGVGEPLGDEMQHPSLLHRHGRSLRCDRLVLKQALQGRSDHLEDREVTFRELLAPAVQAHLGGVIPPVAKADDEPVDKAVRGEPVALLRIERPVHDSRRTRSSA